MMRHRLLAIVEAKFIFVTVGDFNPSTNPRNESAPKAASGIRPRDSTRHCTALRNLDSSRGLRLQH
jgi:hypothetical protein